MTATARLSEPRTGRAQLVSGGPGTDDPERRTARRRFVAGPRPADAADQVRRLHTSGIASTIGFFAPIAEDEATARATAAQYAEAAAGLAGLPAGTRLEIDLPHLGLDVSPGLCVDLVQEVAGNLPTGGRLQFGAEDSGRTDEVLDVAVAAHRRGVPVRATIQANLRRSRIDLEWLIAEEVPVRLVKGGFREPERIAFTDPAEIDAAIRRLAVQALAAQLEFSLATHDGELQAWSAALQPAPELETLLGVLPEVAHQLAAERQVRVYVPFGPGGEDYLDKRLSDEAAALGRNR